MIKVDLSGAEKFFAEGGPDYAAAAKAHETLVGRTGAGADFTGVLVGTIFTLFVVPMFYTFIARRELLHEERDEALATTS